MNRIIFIEGVSGVGKTTTTTLLHEKLRNMGYDIVCHLEGASDNPLDPFNGKYPPMMPIAEFTETYLNCWRGFKKIQHENLYIMDGTLLHHQINDLIRIYNASDEAVVVHLTVLLQVIQHLNPIIFYLASNDVSQRLAHARESREQSIPNEDQILYWKNRKGIDLYVLDKLPVESHILFVDGGWDACLDMMIACVTKYSGTKV